MSKRRSTASMKDGNTGEARLAECLKDKSCASYQNSPVFVEVIAFCNKFDKFFGLSPVSFVELEQALDYEQQNHLVGRADWVRSKALSKLYQELLDCFGFKTEEMSTAQINEALLKQLKKCRQVDELRPDEQILAEFLDADGLFDVCSLSPEQKLAFLGVLIDALMDNDEVQGFSQSFSSDDLRFVPIAVDSNSNKFWYFGDTYLFLERAECEEVAQSAKRRSRNKASKEIRQANIRLFTANRLEIVCKTSGDWTRLLYTYKKEGDVCDGLGKHVENVTALENKRLKQELMNAAIVRSSSRIQYLQQQREEERKRTEELARIRREEEKKRQQEARKRTADEKLKMLYAQKRDFDSEFDTAPEVNTSMTREERFQLREQRKLEQQMKRKENPAFTSRNHSQIGERPAPVPSTPAFNKNPAQSVRHIRLDNGKVQNNYPSPRFKEADKNRIRNVLGIERPMVQNGHNTAIYSQRSDFVQHPGDYQLANVKQYIRRPAGEHFQHQYRSVAPQSQSNGHYLWAPVRTSLNGHKNTTERQRDGHYSIDTPHNRTYPLTSSSNPQQHQHNWQLTRDDFYSTKLIVLDHDYSVNSSPQQHQQHFTTPRETHYQLAEEQNQMFRR